MANHIISKVIILSSFYMGIVLFNNSYSETEPNDNDYQANTVASSSVTSGSINPNSDVDFYKFVVSATGAIDIDVHPSSGLDVAWNLYLDANSDGTVTAGETRDNSYGNSVGIHEKKTGIAIVAGTYYLMVFGMSSTTGTYVDTLKFTQGSGKPDLNVYNQSVNSLQYFPADTIHSICRVRNMGTGSANASTLYYYLSQSTTASGTPLTTASIGSLPPGSYQSVSKAIFIPMSYANGAYYVIYKADGANVVAEDLETNNSASNSFDVTRPTITDCSLSANTATPGDIILAFYTINNPLSYTPSVRLGASLGPSLSDPNNEDLISLASGGASYSRKFLIPTTTAGGDYFFQWDLLTSDRASYGAPILKTNVISIQTQTTTQLTVAVSSPENDLVLLAGESVTLQWTVTGGAGNIQVYPIKDNDQAAGGETNLFSSAQPAAGSCTWTPAAADAGVWYLGVKALDSGANPKTGFAPGKVSVIGKIATPLLGGLSGEQRSGTQYTIAWSQPERANQYLVQESPSSDFTSAPTPMTLSQNSYSTTKTVSALTKFYYRVAARNSIYNCQSDWSNTVEVAVGTKPVLPLIQPTIIYYNPRGTSNWIESSDSLCLGIALSHSKAGGLNLYADIGICYKVGSPQFDQTCIPHLNSNSVLITANTPDTSYIPQVQGRDFMNYFL